MVGCTTIQVTPTVRVWSYDKTTRISILVPTKNSEFNFHYVGWVTVSDGYELTMPRGQMSASEDEIELKLNSKGGDVKLKVGSGSVVTVSGHSDCTVVLKVNDEMGREFKFNGSYTDHLCKR